MVVKRRAPTTKCKCIPRRQSSASNFVPQGQWMVPLYLGVARRVLADQRARLLVVLRSHKSRHGGVGEPRRVPGE